MIDINILPNPDGNNDHYLTLQSNFRRQSVVADEINWGDLVAIASNVLPHYSPVASWEGVARKDWQTRFPDSKKVINSKINYDVFYQELNTNLNSILNTFNDLPTMLDMLNCSRSIGRFFSRFITDVRYQHIRRNLNYYVNSHFEEQPEFMSYLFVRVPQLTNPDYVVDPDSLVLDFLHSTVGRGQDPMPYTYNYTYPGTQRYGLVGESKTCPASAFEIYSALSMTANFLAVTGVMWGKLMMTKPPEFFLPYT